MPDISLQHAALQVDLLGKTYRVPAPYILKNLALLGFSMGRSARFLSTTRYYSAFNTTVNI